MLPISICRMHNTRTHHSEQPASFSIHTGVILGHNIMRGHITESIRFTWRNKQLYHACTVGFGNFTRETDTILLTFNFSSSAITEYYQYVWCIPIHSYEIKTGFYRWLEYLLFLIFLILSCTISSTRYCISHTSMRDYISRPGLGTFKCLLY